MRIERDRGKVLDIDNQLGPNAELEIAIDDCDGDGPIYFFLTLEEVMALRDHLTRAVDRHFKPNPMRWAPGYGDPEGGL